jgi:molecular chaperone DnaK (HSP70)
MLLSNLKKIAEADHGSEVVDCVISVPVFFTEDQRLSVQSLLLSRLASTPSSFLY